MNKNDEEANEMIKNFLLYDLYFLLRKASIDINEKEFDGEGAASCMNTLLQLGAIERLISYAFSGATQEFMKFYLDEGE